MQFAKIYKISEMHFLSKRIRNSLFFSFFFFMQYLLETELDLAILAS